MSTACETLAAGATQGAGPALRAVDCLANEMAAAAFGRLLAPDGVLLPALTILLTLYIGFFAIALLTGRSRIGISSLTPRMITLGLVLTFATSWIAYQSVVWNLAIGAPDQLAGVLMGAKGPATQIFGNRVDILFQAIATAAENAQNIAVQNAAEGGATPTTGQVAGYTPANLMWMGAILLLLGTVGVLVTARIALAVLLALGPVFVVLALFNGTRGLFAGWLRGLVLTAITPLFVVTGGSLMLELALPVANTLLGQDGISGQAAIGLFLIACVHLALMAMILRTATAIVTGWSVFGLAAPEAAAAPAAATAPLAAMPLTAAAATAQAAATQAAAATQRRIVTTTPAVAAGAHAPGEGASRSTRIFVSNPAVVSPGLAGSERRRARGIGSRFGAAPDRQRKLAR